ncbi:ABC transporter permease [Planctomycetota bacterium]
MSTLLQDLRYSVRQLVKQPLFSFIAILMLALGIGANTAVFGLMNSVALRSLPVRNPHELRGINWVGDNFSPMIHGRISITPNGEQISNTFTYPIYREFCENGAGVAEVFAFKGFNSLKPPAVLIRGQAYAVDGMMVSGNFFRGLGLEPVLGQVFTSEYDRPDVAPAALLSYHAWQRYYGLDPNVIGQNIVVDQVNARVIGVLPKGFLGIEKGRRFDVYVPLSLQPQIEGINPVASPDKWCVQVMARLKPSVDEAQVSRSLGTLFTRTIEEMGVDTSKSNLRIVLTDGSGGLSGVLAPNIGRMVKPLYLLFGLVGIVLLVTCINLAGLLLNRGMMRRHEFAVRAALGAGRGRLVRQLLTESVVLSVTGALCGLLLAVWAKSVLARILWSQDTALSLRSDMRVYGFLLAVLVPTTVLFGLLPAWRAVRSSPANHLKNRTSLGTPRLGLSKLLISAQVGLSLLLLVGAGLFTRSLINIQRIETGFNSENLLVFRADTKGREAEFCSALGALPGVQDVTYSGLALLMRFRNSTTIPLPGNRSGKLNLLLLDVGETFLETMEIPLLRGRAFQARDMEDTAQVAIVNQTLAQSAFPEENPIDRVLTVRRKQYRIVGVCGDSKYYDLKVEYEPTIFLPTRRGTCYAVRTAFNPQGLVPALRKTLTAIDPSVALSDVKTLRTRIAENTLQERSFAYLATSLAFLAVLQSCIGLYGLMAHSVTHRTNEIGVRMALGATSRTIAWPILRNALFMAGLGIVVGLPFVFFAVKLIRNYLFGIQPHDPVTVASAVVLLLGVTLLAAWIPARRAAKIDPMEALRYE